MPQQTKQQLAAALDALDDQTLHDTLLALAAYKYGKPAFEKIDTSGKEGDSTIRENACEQFNVPEDLLSLLIQVYSADWQQITDLMANAGNRDEILKHFPRL